MTNANAQSARRPSSYPPSRPTTQRTPTSSASDTLRHCPASRTSLCSGSDSKVIPRTIMTQCCWFVWDIFSRHKIIKYLKISVHSTDAIIKLSQLSIVMSDFGRLISSSFWNKVAIVYYQLIKKILSRNDLLPFCHASLCDRSLFSLIGRPTICYFLFGKVLFV